jgi:hypothetical protein
MKRAVLVALGLAARGCSDDKQAADAAKSAAADAIKATGEAMESAGEGMEPGKK